MNSNNLGIRMLSPKLRKYLFNRHSKINPDLEKSILSSLVKFDLIDPKKIPQTDHSSSNNAFDQLELPNLNGQNIDEHINNISYEQTKTYLKLLNFFSNQSLPPIPTNFKFEPGWTKYDSNTGKTSQVDYPDENALVLDVECLVKYQNMPVMATAVSTNGWYTWCSERLVKNDFKYVKNLHLNDLIPLESEDLAERKARKRIIIGHNVGFDRSFIKQQYYLEKSAMRFMDTMSMHIACSGFTHEQRDVVLNIRSQENHLNELDSDDFNRTIRPGFLWRGMGSLNNLKDVHKFYCADSKTKMNKETRNLFVNGEPEDIIDQFQNLMAYCATDTKATFEVFVRLFEIFLDRFEHPATLAGMLEMSTMYLPVNKNWNKYIQSCDSAFKDSENLLNKLLERSANEACKYKNQYEYDPWLSQLDWSTRTFDLSKKSSETKSKDLNKLNDGFLKIIENDINQNVFLQNSSQKTKNEIDNDLKELCIGSKTKEAFNTFIFIPKNKPFLCGYPNWYRDLCMKFTDENWEPGPNLISTKTRSTPYLLRLTWNGYPMHYLNKFAWGYLIEEESYQKQFEQEINKINKKKANLNKVDIYKTTYVFQKIPHKYGEKFNVGNPLAKSFLSKINDGIISSIPEKAAGLALKIHTQISYWEMNQKRIRDQKAIFNNNIGAILPISVVSGTVTRRAVEPTWLTASNYSKDRIGSELKAMIQSPDGYYLVGADVDSQELWIAATLGDSEYKIHGSTPLGWMNLQGKKSDGTDMHSKTASLIGISRDEAKVFNYGRIYGAGKKFAQKLLMQFNPKMSDKEAFAKASKLYSETKGLRNKSKRKFCQDESLSRQLNDFSNDQDEDVTAGKWSGGTESEMFNKLEEIAISQYPKTPVLNARISQALEPDVVDKNFITSRINWVVQSSAVDYLHIMLVCMNWLIEKYDIQARFSISIHDEIRYIVKDEDRYRAALALQLTNLYTRAIFSYKMGFDDLPMSVAFFSGVDIDRCLRKEPDLDFVSPSNPNGLKHGYGIDFGQCVDISQILDVTKGKLIKQNFEDQKI